MEWFHTPTLALHLSKNRTKIKNINAQTLKIGKYVLQTLIR